ncbi:hypothetical protein A167_03088 [Alcanivorax sp. S71-1-4]|uniref:tRNA (adenosine(37)-N6)-threonylcarbamoyltransferase complex dimerization subunit type 1 TsaB n=1 Tax=Alcanivorax sp. S71-1-4 TaxID=1177159 RepID=UPI0016A487A0|nr:tRNA (adenosine(37)-N6)-threonylcarbamoyltransferase complex dimerization subunit type 1 TsaB [Alcanivorax sp. S71-1-4]KAF0806964.1 hypothetical protein A167_03088 [Alcanivorax sp. S71-1-4]
MKLIGIETATESCSVALWQDGDLLERFEMAPRRQTELVLPMVEALLAEAGLTASQLDGVAFGRGPGAFTGVRVAVAVAQGLAFAIDRPVLGISTLASAALAAFDRGARGPLLTAFDARMNELYLAVYAQQGDSDALQVLVEDCLASPLALPALPREVRTGTGSGDVHRAALQQALPALEEWLPDGYPRAATIVRLAAPGFAAGEGVDAAQARPVYLRDQVIQGANR